MDSKTKREEAQMAKDLQNSLEKEIDGKEPQKEVDVLFDADAEEKVEIKKDKEELEELKDDEVEDTNEDGLAIVRQVAKETGLDDEDSITEAERKYFEGETDIAPYESVENIDLIEKQVSQELENEKLTEDKQLAKPQLPTGVSTELHSEYLDSEEYEEFLDECKAVVTEHEFNSRWETILSYHGLGERISEEKAKFSYKDAYGKKIIKDIAERVGKSEQSVYKAIAFYEMYPNIDLLPNGKNVSWYQICKTLLKKKEEQTKLDSGEKEPIDPTDDGIDIEPKDNLDMTVLVSVRDLLDIYAFPKQRRDFVKHFVNTATGSEQLNDILEAYKTSEHFENLNKIEQNLPEEELI